MVALTDTFENRLIDFIFRGQALGITGASAAAGTGPTTLFIGLFTANPTDTGGGTEVSGNAYARVAVTSSLANWAGTQGAGTTVVSSGTSGTTSNNNAITFPAPTPASWGLITGMAIFDASTGGNMLAWSALTTSQTANIGVAPVFAPGTLTFQIDN